MSAPACRACGSARTRPRGEKTGAYLRRTFTFHDCADCGLLFVEPFSGFGVYDDAYYRGEGPDPYVDYETEYRDWRSSDRRHELADLVGIAADHLRRNRAPDQGAEPLRWLDFGCGAGALLKCLRDTGRLAGRNLELTGHDVGSWADRLRSEERLRILGPEELAALPGGSFDVISMIEVIEHLPFPQEPVELAARLLRPGGLLLLTTGNLGSPAARRAGLAHHYCAPEIHVSLFNPDSLARLYARSGLLPVKVRFRGAIRFKVLKTLRHRPRLRSIASLALRLPPVIAAVDLLYGVSAMPCAVKPRPPA